MLPKWRLTAIESLEVALWRVAERVKIWTSGSGNRIAVLYMWRWRHYCGSVPAVDVQLSFVCGLVPSDKVCLVTPNVVRPRN